MNDQIIGDEGVAQLHEQHDAPDLAAIHRMTGEQAVQVLVHLSGMVPDEYADALRQAGVTGQVARR
ncbi:MAG TPA: hypothetical protein VF053_16285 [Streptosporangiales bacterium]